MKLSLEYGVQSGSTWRFGYGYWDGRPSGAARMRDRGVGHPSKPRLIVRPAWHQVGDVDEENP